MCKVHILCDLLINWLCLNLIKISSVTAEPLKGTHLALCFVSRAPISLGALVCLAPLITIIMFSKANFYPCEWKVVCLQMQSWGQLTRLLFIPTISLGVLTTWQLRNNRDGDSQHPLTRQEFFTKKLKGS